MSKKRWLLLLAELPALVLILSMVDLVELIQMQGGSFLWMVGAWLLFIASIEYLVRIRIEYNKMREAEIEAKLNAKEQNKKML